MTSDGGSKPGKKQIDVSYTQNRELSWLQFNKRVMEEATDKTVPLFERLKFIAIFVSNLDEFFMVRVGSLYDLSLVDPEDRDSKTLWTPAEQIERILTATKPLIKLKDKLYRKTMRALASEGVEELDLDRLDKEDRKFCRDYYRDGIRPVLSPQIIDSRHPFPHLKNKELYIAATLTDENGESELGLCPVPETLPDLVFVNDEPLRFVRTEQLILRYANKLFGSFEVQQACIISVTRNADVDFDEEKFEDSDADYRMKVSRLLKKRSRLMPVRLEVEGKDADDVVDALLPHLHLKKGQVFTSTSPLAMGWAFGLQGRLNPLQERELTYPPFSPRASKVFDSERPVLEQVAEGDKILFYPYDSIDPFLRMLREAANDPDVVSIKITVYRLASNSRVGTALCEAAENGKDVTVLMELRARFDEAHNIDWSRRMEEAGCHIIYGIDFYKCHSKVCLITKQVDGKVYNYTQVGTGNYNEKTARLYTDLSLFTANERIGRDAVTFFQNMLLDNLNGVYETLLVAPSNMKRTFLALIEKEIAKGTAGRIRIKANSLTERDIIDKLMEASCAGVQVELNLRGICCLLPGIPGKTENIHVRSIVGQFLEHSRIYCFGTGESRQIYISSADVMTRNLDHRVEVAAHIFDPAIKDDISRFLDKLFADNCKARELQPDGTYRMVETAPDEPRFCAQDWLVEHPLQHVPAEPEPGETRVWVSTAAGPVPKGKEIQKRAKRGGRADGGRGKRVLKAVAKGGKAAGKAALKGGKAAGKGAFGLAKKLAGRRKRDRVQ